MTDRELLELSAKAVGIRLEWDGDPRKWQPMYYEGKTYHSWDPLDDDGQALQLAVKLKMTLYIGSAGAEVHVPLTAIRVQEFSGERYSATRRAIVRAAAEIGKNMGEQHV